MTIIVRLRRYTYKTSVVMGDDRCSPSSARVSCIHSSSITSKSSGCEIREKCIVADMCTVACSEYDSLGDERRGSFVHPGL